MITTANPSAGGSRTLGKQTGTNYNHSKQTRRIKKHVRPEFLADNPIASLERQHTWTYLPMVLEF